MEHPRQPAFNRDELVLSGRIADKRIRVWQRGEGELSMYAYDIRGGGWKVGSFFTTWRRPAAIWCFEAAVAQCRERHPRAKLDGPHNEV